MNKGCCHWCSKQIKMLNKVFTETKISKVNNRWTMKLIKILFLPRVLSCSLDKPGRINRDFNVCGRRHAPYSWSSLVTSSSLPRDQTKQRLLALATGTHPQIYSVIHQKGGKEKRTKVVAAEHQALYEWRGPEEINVLMLLFIPNRNPQTRAWFIIMKFSISAGHAVDVRMRKPIITRQAANHEVNAWLMPSFKYNRVYFTTECYE